MNPQLTSPHVMSSQTASSIVNTTYVVFLGLIFQTVFIVQYSSRVKVGLIFDRANLRIAIFLLVYFLFSWLAWNSLFRFQSAVRDYYVALCVLGIVSLGASFMLSLSEDFLERPVTFWAFLAYALLAFTDDMLLLSKGLRANERGMSGSRWFVYVRLGFVALKIFCIAFLTWGFVLMLAQIQQWQNAYLERMQYAIIGFAFLKGIDYVLLTRWPEARQIAGM